MSLSLRESAVADALREQPVARAAVTLGREVAIAVRAVGSTRRFRRLRGQQELKVHLGCGADVRRGWVNVDLAPEPREDAIVIAHDLRKGLPLESASCSLIYSSHFFEHLDYKAGVRLMRDCHRVLQHGGALRFAMPNFRGMVEAYLRGDITYLELVDIREALPYVEPGTETIVDHVNYGVYQHGEHKTIYDEEKLSVILRAIGFSTVTESSFNAEIDPDEPVRRRYSFYLEAVK